MRQGWSALERLSAGNRLRSAMDGGCGLRAVAEAAAEAILVLLSAKTVTIVLLDDRGHRDVVNVGELAQGEHRFPEDWPYEASNYPTTATRLLGGQHYVRIGSGLQLLDAYQNLAPGDSIGTAMGLPIIHADAVWGELFLVRDIHAPVFTDDDLQVAFELAGQFGMRLPRLLEV